MRDNWIGKMCNTTGPYRKTPCEELQYTKALAPELGIDKVYQFNSRFGARYYISDPEAIEQIEYRLGQEQAGIISDIYAYLYQLVINEYGMVHFLHTISLYTARERDTGYKLGKIVSMNDIREALGLKLIEIPTHLEE